MIGCPTDEGIDASVSGFATESTGAGEGEGTASTGEIDACGAIQAEMVECTEVNSVAMFAAQPPACGAGQLGEVLRPAEPALDWVLSWPAPVEETDPALVGVWTSLVTNEIPLDEEAVDPHLPVHSIHRPTGKFLQFGAHREAGGGYDYDTDKVVWYPPAPCLDPFGEGVESCDVQFDLVVATEAIESHVHVNQAGGDPDMTEFNLFCAGHVNLPPVDAAELLEPATLTVGGAQPSDVNQGAPGAFLFREDLPDDEYVEPVAAEWNELDALSNSRWYPTVTVLSDANIVVPGGVFNAAGSVACKQAADGMVQLDDECTCDPEDAEDFYTMNGICGADGICSPELVDAELEDQLGFDPCDRIEQGVVPGMELGVRTGADVIAWELLGLGIGWGSYPQLFVLPDLPHFTTDGTHLGGKLVMVGSEAAFPVGSGAALWDPTLPEAPLVEIGGPSCARGSSAVMFASDRVLKFGGVVSFADGEPETSRLSEVLDLSGPCPEWRPPTGGGELALPRHFAAGVLLPDGDVMTAGGGIGNERAGDFDEELTPENDRLFTAFTAELFDRDSESWCRLADLPNTEPDNLPAYRGYHAQSFLLPDGRVYLGAGGNFSDATTHYNYQLFAPPYLFWGPRPDISPDQTATTVNDITELLTGGASVRFTRDNAVAIERATLVKLSASTHQFDQEQRFVELEFELDPEGGWIDIEPPTSTCYATPGYYMLFVLSDEGVPSVADYIAVRGTCDAAEVSAVAPIHPTPDPTAINDLAADDAAGLRASCAGEGSTLRVEDFRRSLLDLCTATRACPTNGSVDVEVRFGGTTGQANAEADEVLSTATIEFVDGVPSFTGDGIELDVAGTEFTSQVDLGPGDHTIDVCGTLDILSACIEQPLRIDPVVADSEAADYRAAEIEPGALDVARRAPGPGLALGDDDVVAVPLPDGFIFPFFDEEVDTLWIGANGGIRVTNGAVPAANAGLPSSIGPEIAVYWDDLDPATSGRVATYHRGDRFVVAWEDVAVASGGRMSAQAHLFRDGRIEFHYPLVSDGASAYGVGATVGIQFDGDALELSEDDDALLSSHVAFAIDRTTCIASGLRIPDSTPCADRVTALPAEIEICAAQGEASLATPAVPEICAGHRDGFVSGGLFLDGERQPVADDGTVRLFPGEYEARWSIYEPRSGPWEHEIGYPVGEVTTQPITVAFSDDEEVCCRDDQALQVLTSGDDGPMYVCTTGACCVVALEGNDILIGADSADTLLGREGVDTVYAGGGDDVVVGGAGNDILLGGDDDDVLLGGDDDDIVSGDAGDDVVHGGPGADLVVGKDDDDQLWGGAGDDEINEYSYGGADTALPGPGMDEVYTGAGDDQVVVIDLCEVEDGEVLDGGAGTDTLWLPAGVEVEDLENLGVTVTGFEVTDTIVGQPWGASECAA